MEGISEPGFEQGFYEEMTLGALRLGALTALAAAELQTAEYIAARAAKGEETAVRFVIHEVVSVTKPLTELVAPSDSDRVVIIPTPELDTPTTRLILRIPRNEGMDHSEAQFRDFFVERVVGPNIRERYLINRQGVWRYNNAADIDEIAPGIFKVRGATEPESMENVAMLNRELGDHPHEEGENRERSDNPPSPDIAMQFSSDTST